MTVLMIPRVSVCEFRSVIRSRGDHTIKNHKSAFKERKTLQLNLILLVEIFDFNCKVRARPTREATNDVRLHLQRALILLLHQHF